MHAGGQSEGTANRNTTPQKQGRKHKAITNILWAFSKNRITKLHVLHAICGTRAQ
jgi:hypothetical protein